MEFQQRLASGCELVVELARRFGEVQLRVTGASMLPSVRPGDVLSVRHCVISDLQPGQILLYRRHGKLVAHRVIRIHSDSVTTRGDSVYNDDLPIEESDIVGQVFSVLRRGRPVSDQPSLLHRAASYILRRSDFCTRLAMRMAHYRHASTKKDLSWA